MARHPAMNIKFINYNTHNKMYMKKMNETKTKAALNILYKILLYI